MTIKPEVLAAIENGDNVCELSCVYLTNEDWQTIRAELLAMDAELTELRTHHAEIAETVKDAERWRALHWAEAPMVTITGSQLARGVRPGDYAVPWDWPITSRTRIRMIVMNDSAWEVG